MQENSPATTETPARCGVCGAPMLPGFDGGLCEPCRAERGHLMREDDRERYEEGLE